MLILSQLPLVFGKSIHLFPYLVLSQTSTVEVIIQPLSSFTGGERYQVIKCPFIHYFRLKQAHVLSQWPISWLDSLSLYMKESIVPRYIWNLQCITTPHPISYLSIHFFLLNSEEIHIFQNNFFLNLTYFF
jgi:hypothetical protein